MNARLLCCLLLLPVLPPLMSGCASYTYQAEEWRITLFTTVDEDASAKVRYVGIGVNSTNASAEMRAAALDKFMALANDTKPKHPLTPGLKDVSRSAYVEGGTLVLEESGIIRNPLSWFEQLSIANDISANSRFISKKDISPDQIILATNGRIVDENTYGRMQQGNVPRAIQQKLPVELGSDTQWPLQEQQRINDELQSQTLQVIIWPRGARALYWKVSAPGFSPRGQWQSLAPDFSSRAAATFEATLPAPTPEAAPAAAPIVAPAAAPATPATTPPAVPAAPDTKTTPIH